MEQIKTKGRWTWNVNKSMKEKFCPFVAVSLMSVFPYSAFDSQRLKAGDEGQVIIEVFTQLDNNTVRGVALTPTQGLARGSVVIDTGKPLEVPWAKSLWEGF